MTNMRKPLMVSLWAPPGVGKSTTAALVFNVLKNRGHRAELVLEFAKDITYEQNWKAFQDSFYVTANQERRNSRLVGEVDIIVTDSPPGLGLLYCQPSETDILRDMVLHYRQRYENMDWLLIRDPDRPYQRYGRTQTLEQSIALEGDLVRHMKRICDKGYHTTSADRFGGVYIADAVERRLDYAR
jgi:hypothetical protein